jgi:hypothetical protein
MATPDATQAPSFDQQVNEIVSNMTQDAEGNYQLPDGQYSDALKYAANAERRRRSTESALAKTRAQLKATEEFANSLHQKVAPSYIPKEEMAELENLKYVDPEAYYHKRQELENKANAAFKTDLESVNQKAETFTRAHVLEEFNQQHPDLQMTPEMLQDELPPRIMNKLTKGQVPFDVFLLEAYDYLKTPKVVGGQQTKALPNLGKASGANSPAKTSIERETAESYRRVIF